MSLVETLIVVALVGGLLAGSMALVTSVTKFGQKNNLVQFLAKTREAMIQSVRGSEGLAALAKSNSVACLANRESCGPPPPPGGPPWQALTLVNADGFFYSKANDPYFGLTINGQNCTSFPSPSCPIQYLTEWSYACLDLGAGKSTCDSPQIRLRATLKLDASFGEINSRNYDFELSLGQVVGTYEQACTSLGGDYVPGPSPGCRMPMEGRCPTTTRSDGVQVPQYVAGYSRATKQKICRPAFQGLLVGECAVGTVMFGIRPDGTLDCRLMRGTCINPGDPCCANPFAASCRPIIPPTTPGCAPGDLTCCNDCTIVPTTTEPTASDGGGGDGGCGGGGSGGDGCPN